MGWGAKLRVLKASGINLAAHVRPGTKSLIGLGPSWAELCAGIGRDPVTGLKVGEAAPVRQASGAYRHYVKYATAVPEETARIGLRTALKVSEDLGLLGWKIRWIEPGTAVDHAFYYDTPDPQPYAGLHRPGEKVVCVSADLSLTEVVRVAAHELRHGFHSAWTERGVARPSAEAEERDCDSYAAAVVRDLAAGR